MVLSCQRIACGPPCGEGVVEPRTEVAQVAVTQCQSGIAAPGHAFHFRWQVSKIVVELQAFAAVGELVANMGEGEHLAQAGNTVAVKACDVADVVRTVAYLLAGKTAEIRIANRGRLLVIVPPFYKIRVILPLECITAILPKQTPNVNAQSLHTCLYSRISIFLDNG